MEKASAESEEKVTLPDTAPAEDLSSQEVGELAVDVYQTADSVIVKAPMAGVDPKDIDLAITDDSVTVRGRRQAEHTVKDDEYVVKECYWGSFERSLSLPVPVDSEKARAQYKHGLLTITIPKAVLSKTRKIEIETT